MDPFSNSQPQLGAGSQIVKSAAKSASESEAATSRWGAAIRGLGKALASFAVESVVFSAATKTLNKQLEEMGRAIESAKRVQELQRQLKTLSGGAAEAGRRMRELVEISKSGRFDLGDLTKAEIALDALSRGALGGGQSLRQLAGIAQDTGAPVDSLAESVGDLYGALRDGRPVANTTEALVAFGAITPAVAGELERLQESGTGMAATWAVVEQALAKAEQRAGSAKSTLSDLESQRANVEGARDAAIGDQFLEGRKASERASTTFASATTEGAVDAVRPLAAVYTALQTAREGLVNFIVQWKGLGTAVTVVSQIFSAVLITVLIGTAKSMVMFIGSMGLAVARFTGLTRAAAGLAITLRAMTIGTIAVTSGLGVFVAILSLCTLRVIEHSQRLNEARKKAEDSALANEEVTESLRKQAAAIQTVKDRAAAQITTLEKLAEAQRELVAAEATTAKTKPGAAEHSGAVNAEGIAYNNVQAILRTYEQISQIKADSLAPDREARDLALERYQIEKQISQQADDARIERLSVDRRPAAISNELGKVGSKLDSAEAFQQTLKRDTAEFDPIRRRLDLAKQSGDPEAIFQAQAAVDKFKTAPGRNKNFLLGQDIAEREAARARLDNLAGDKERLITDRTSSQADVDVADQKLSAEQNAVTARYGSLDAISPKAIAQLDDQRRRNEIDNDPRPLRQRQAQLQESGLAAANAKGDAAIENDLAAKRAQAEREIIALKAKGYDLAMQEATIRKNAIGAEIAVLQKRIGNPRFNDQETKGKISGLLNEAGAIDKDLATQRESGKLTLKGAQAEVKAQRLENGGHTEAAARKRDEVRLEERILELKRSGLTSEEAVKQARAEMKQNRRNRAQQRMDGGEGEATIASDFTGDPTFRMRRENERKAADAVKSIPVDSMTGIGGNSGAGDGPNGLLREIRDELRKANRGDVRDPALRTPQWDDDQRRLPTPY